MAVRAELIQHDELLHLDLYPDERRLRATDEPDVPGFQPSTNLWFYWDDEKLERGEREFLGIEVEDLKKLTEAELRGLEHLGLPRIDIPEVNLFNVTVADALRWARQAYDKRRAGAIA